jgi:hypothetical protein
VSDWESSTGRRQSARDDQGLAKGILIGGTGFGLMAVFVLGAVILTGGILAVMLAVKVHRQVRERAATYPDARPLDRYARAMRQVIEVEGKDRPMDSFCYTMGFFLPLMFLGGGLGSLPFLVLLLVALFAWLGFTLYLSLRARKLEKLARRPAFAGAPA